MLTIPIKKEWFDMIKSGEKPEEYREMTLYWTKRFEKYLLAEPNTAFEVILRNGYGKDRPSIKCTVTIDIDYGYGCWGAWSHDLYYVLRIKHWEEYKET